MSITMINMYYFTNGLEGSIKWIDSLDLIKLNDKQAVYGTTWAHSCNGQYDEGHLLAKQWYFYSKTSLDTM